MTNESKCFKCGDPTIRAHLLPKALMMDARVDADHLMVGNTAKTGHDLSKSGIFDDGILCKKCDNILNNYDKYAIKFCRKFEEARVIDPNNPSHFVVQSVDTNLLVKFVIACIWRCSISARPEASLVDLGPYNKQFIEVLFDNGDVSKRPVVTFWGNRSNTMDLRKAAFLPALCKGAELRVYWFMLSGLTFGLKVDSRPYPQKFDCLAVNGKDHIESAYREFDSSPEMADLLKTALLMGIRKAPFKRD